MRSRVCLALLGLFWLLSVRESGAAGDSRMNAPVHHELFVRLSPEQRRIEVTDTVTLPADLDQPADFLLHKGLSPASADARIEESSLPEGDGRSEIFSRYRAFPRETGVRRFTLRYAGVIHHPLEESEKEQARGMKGTPGIIAAEGVVLSGGSGWYPDVAGRPVIGRLTVTAPRGFEAISQGDRTVRETDEAAVRAGWSIDQPQEEFHLVAGPFTEYRRKTGRVEAMVFLREPDEGLAAKYLEATGRYIEMYEKLLGPYPYGKFALVENFWETGYGMPSFTLLGSRIIRMPFILTSSYPHEILHNWWGNGVYPDYSAGNWSEGLTAYLSDLLIKEQKGGAAEYREATLQKYADYAARNRDFPLREFRSRHSASSEAVGYGKSLMVFHMLRRMLGDDVFVKGLREFYSAHRFRTASFTDLKSGFEEVSGRNLGGFFAQWVDGAGAPILGLGPVTVSPEGDGYRLSGRLDQTQPGEPYTLDVPVSFTLEGRKDAFQVIVPVTGRSQPFEVVLPGRPLRIDVDPDFDLFRRLDRAEIPPAISQALGAERMLIVLPSGVAEPLRAAYRKLAESVARSGPDETRIVTDAEVDSLSADGAVCILGWENRFLPAVRSSLPSEAVAWDETGLRIGASRIGRTGHSIVLTARHPGNADHALLFIAADAAAPLPGLGRKLPHYHKYSYLGFEGDEPANVLKGRWAVTGSPLSRNLAGGDPGKEPIVPAARASVPALIQIPDGYSEERMMDVIRTLSSPAFEGRGYEGDALGRVADWLADRFREAGLSPSGGSKEGFLHDWEVRLDPGPDSRPRTVILKNVIGVIPGTDAGLAGQGVVVGAHYDGQGFGWPDGRVEERGRLHPGADDNASGVAVLLELARALRDSRPLRTIVFVAFTGEEAGRLGSLRLVRSGGLLEKSFAMMNLDTVGRLGRGKILVLGGQSAGEWVHIFRGVGYMAGVDVEMVSEELGSSDQASFIEAGIPAVQLFTGPHADYHRPTDLPETIDRAGLVRVAAVAKEVVEYLADRREPLSVTPAGRVSPPAPPSSGRKVSLGAVPDFAYSGPGMRLQGVVAGSPAESAGLAAGDVITEIGDQEFSGIREFSEALKRLQPGDSVTLTYLREGRRMKASVAVVSR